MKQMCALLLCLALVMSLLAGCEDSAGSVETPQTQPMESTEESTVEVSEIPPESVDVTVPKDGLLTDDEAGGVPIGETGQIRVAYKGNICSVQYVTSVDQLPDYPELQAYDEAYFQDRALLLVFETVTSGSVEVRIQDIRVEGTRGLVQLSHEMQGDAGTAVMTTWLVWAEVEAGLDYTWIVSNPMVESQLKRS